ncbi:MAG: hypothetical protein IIT97_00820 [Mycoplasmataceae bacterium]|nr:hypothetical protein [Mycoplasmataceae bacterium]
MQEKIEELFESPKDITKEFKNLNEKDLRQWKLEVLDLDKELKKYPEAVADLDDAIKLKELIAQSLGEETIDRIESDDQVLFDQEIIENYIKQKIDEASNENESITYALRCCGLFEDDKKLRDFIDDGNSVFKIECTGYIKVMKNQELTDILKDHIKVDVLEKDMTLQKDDELTLK